MPTPLGAWKIQSASLVLYCINFGEHGSNIIDGLLPLFFKSGEQGRELGRELGSRAAGQGACREETRRR
jgi:hypothetical protein